VDTNIQNFTASNAASLIDIFWVKLAKTIFEDMHCTLARQPDGRKGLRVQ
jgi:hypothetical protein